MMDFTLVQVLTLVVFALLQLLDVFTTIVGMRQGATEDNGFIAGLMDRLGVFWPVAKLSVALFGLWLMWPVLIAVWVTIVFYVWVVRHNFQMIDDHNLGGRM